MKKYFFLILLPGLFSCHKFLDQQPVDYVSDQVTIVDAASAQTAVRGIYRKLSNDNYYGSLFQSFGYLSGDMCNGRARNPSSSSLSRIT